MNEDRLIELMRELFEKMGSSSMDNFNKKLEESTKGMTAEEAQRKKNQLLQQQVNSEFDKFDKAVKRGRKSLLDLGPTIDHFEESLEEMSDSIEKTETEQKRNALASQYLTAQYKKAAGDITLAVGKIFVNGVAKATSSLVRSLQGNASGATIAGEFLTNAIDTTQNAFSTVTKTGETLGTTLAMNTNPKLNKFGVGLAVASVALEGISSSMSELAKFGIEVMVKEVDKTVKAFNETAAAGALFTGGMTGVRSAAAEAGLTVEQFSNVIKTNAGALADTGLTVTEAAKRMGQVGKVIKSSGIETNLLKLGFGFEAQAGLIAETMSNMRRSGVLGTATNAQVAEATEKYAKNLRFIADLTGKDADAAMKAANAKLNQYAADAKIRELSKELNVSEDDVRQSVKNYMALLDSQGQSTDGFLQQLATSNKQFGGANAEAAEHQSGVAKMNAAFLLELNRGNLDTASQFNKVRETLGDAATGINQFNRGVATAALFPAGSDLKGFAESSMAVRNIANVLSGSPEQIQAAIEERIKTEDKVTEDLLIAEKKSQELRIEQERILTGQLAKFSKVVAVILENLEATVKKYMGQFKDRSMWDAAMHIAGSTLGGVGTGATAAAGYSWMGGPAAPAVATGLTIGGTVIGAGMGIYDVIQGNYAAGGIVHRPELAMIGEGGNSEAVVPLPDNRSIPVKMTGNSMDTKEMVSAIQQQSGVLNQILVVMKENNQLTSGILQTSY
jgi:septal ring factor EnvC (AmiA/AmiB activator)